MFCASFLILTVHVQAAAVPRKLVGRSGTRLIVGGRTLFPSFGNQYYLWYKPSFLTDELVSDGSRMGLSALRLFAFCEGTSKDGFCFQPTRGVFDEATFQKLDYAIYQAGRHGLRMILPLVDQWDDGFGGMRQYVNWVKQAYPDDIPADLRETWLETVNVNSLSSGSPEFLTYQRYHDLFYTNAHARQWYKDYVASVLSRVNRYTNRTYKDEPAILMWELANEPRCQSDPTGDTLKAWITEMAAFIKERDPNHLLSTGEEGWYRDPLRPGDFRYDGSLGDDYIGHHQIPGIDACSFHMYLDTFQLTEAQGVQWIADHIADCHRAVGKPAYFGEYGVKVNRASGARVDTVLHTFATDPEGWVTDFAYTPESPQRVDAPSQDGNGAIVYHLANAIGSGQASPDAGGAKFAPDPGADLSGFDWLSGRIYVPAGAPMNLTADFYAASGPDWHWTDGPDAALIPGQWQEVALATRTMAAPSAVRKFGMRVSAGATPYQGDVYFDHIVGINGDVEPALVQMQRRNRLYEAWGNALLDAQGDGSGFWYFSGLQEDGRLDPDPSHFAVFYPEDDGTVQVLRHLSAQLMDRSDQPFPLWDGCEVPGSGKPSSGYSDASGFAIDTRHVRQGKGSCRLDYQPSGFQKAYWEFSPLDENWSDRSALELLLYSPQAGLEASVAISTGADWTWHESANVRLRKGWNRLRFDLQSATWKTAASSWQLTQRIANPSQVHRLSIGLFGYTGAGAIWVDPIELRSPPRIVDLRQAAQAIHWSGEDDRGHRPHALQFSYRIDGGAFSAWSHMCGLSLRDLHALLGAGEHALEVQVRDSFGFVSELKRLRIIVP